jgi:hypothetical protein
MSTQYRVRYKPNPKYQGHYPGPDVPGIQGTFGHPEKAEAAAASCKRYFNTEKFIDEVLHSDGKVTNEERTAQHDNVIVWTETLVSGEVREAEKELASV